MDHNDETHSGDLLTDIIEGLIDQIRSAVTQLKIDSRRIRYDFVGAPDQDIIESVSGTFETQGIEVEFTAQGFPILHCRCVLQKIEDFGGLDKFGHTVCQKHLKVCNRCMEQVALHNSRQIEGKLYCYECATSESMMDFTKKATSLLLGMSQPWSLSDR